MPHKPLRFMRSQAWLDGLRDMCRYINRPNETIVEIGSYRGESAQIFCEHFKRVICVDPFVSQRGAVVQRTLYETLKSRFNWIHIKKGSRAAAKFFDNDELSIVYIDALHDYQSVKTDIDVWFPKVKFGGILCGHDYAIPMHPGVQQAVDERFGKPDMIFPDSSWLIHIDERFKAKVS